MWIFASANILRPKGRGLELDLNSKRLAVLSFENQAPVHLNGGDSINIPAHKKHRWHGQIQTTKRSVSLFTIECNYLTKTDSGTQEEIPSSRFISRKADDSLILITFVWQLFAHLLAVFLAELLNPTSSINNLLLTCVKRMTLRTYLNIQGFVHGRACFKFIAATASHGYFLIIWMNVCFHCLYP